MTKAILFFYNDCMDYRLIGKIVKPFGLKGEVKCDCYSDFIAERFAKGSIVYIKKADEYLPFKVAHHRLHKGRLLVSFTGYEDINLIEGYCQCELYKAEDDIPPLKEGEYYFHDLIGLKVKMGEDTVGEVIAVEEGVKYNFLRVLKSDQKSSLVPFIPPFIAKVDLKEGIIELKTVGGLL